MLKGARNLILIEVKATSTPLVKMAKPILRLLPNISNHNIRSYVIHQGADLLPNQNLTPEVKAVSLQQLLLATKAT